MTFQKDSGEYVLVGKSLFFIFRTECILNIFFAGLVSYGEDTEINGELIGCGQVNIV